MKKGQRSWDEFWRQNRQTKRTWRNTKILTFALIIASTTLKAVSLQLNGILMIWKIQQAIQDDAMGAARIHPAVHPGNRAEVFIWQKFPARLPRSLLEKPRSREPSQSALWYNHTENFTRDIEVRRDLRNWACPVNRAYLKRPLGVDYKADFSPGWSSPRYYPLRLLTADFSLFLCSSTE